MACTCHITGRSGTSQERARDAVRRLLASGDPARIQVGINARLEVCNTCCDHGRYCKALVVHAGVPRCTEQPSLQYENPEAVCPRNNW